MEQQQKSIFQPIIKEENQQQKKYSQNSFQSTNQLPRSEINLNINYFQQNPQNTFQNILYNEQSPQVNNYNYQYNNQNENALSLMPVFSQNNNVPQQESQQKYQESQFNLQNQSQQFKLPSIQLFKYPRNQQQQQQQQQQLQQTSYEESKEHKGSSDNSGKSLQKQQQQSQRYKTQKTYTFSGENISQLLLKENKIYDYNFFSNIAENQQNKEEEENRELKNGDLFYKKYDKNGKFNRHDSLQICNCGHMRTHGSQRSNYHYKKKEFKENSESIDCCSQNLDYFKITKCIICGKINNKQDEILTFNELYSHLKRKHFDFVIDFESLIQWIKSGEKLKGVQQSNELENIDNDQEFICVGMKLRIRQFFKNFLIEKLNKTKTERNIEQYITTTNQEESNQNNNQFPNLFHGKNLFNSTQNHFKENNNNNNNRQLQFSSCDEIEPIYKKVHKNTEDDSQQQSKEQQNCKVLDKKSMKKCYRYNGESLSTKLFTYKRIFTKKYFSKIFESKGKLYYQKKYRTSTEQGEKVITISNKNDLQEICECGFMRVNGSSRHFSDHYSSYNCLLSGNNKIQFNDCLICSAHCPSGRPWKFSELYHHLKKHQLKNELLQHKEDLPYDDIFACEFSQLEEFYFREKLQVENQLSMNSMEFQKLEFVHVRVESFIKRKLIAEFK